MNISLYSCFRCHRSFAWPITELDYARLINLNIQPKRRSYNRTLLNEYSRRYQRAPHRDIKIDLWVPRNRDSIGKVLIALVMYLNNSAQSYPLAQGSNCARKLFRLTCFSPGELIFAPDKRTSDTVIPQNTIPITLYNKIHHTQIDQIMQIYGIHAFCAFPPFSNYFPKIRHRKDSLTNYLPELGIN